MSARVFTLTITVDDEADGHVEVQEKGDKANRGKAKVPPGIFGIREGLRAGGQLVREYYRTSQRRLVLEAREAEVNRRRADRVAAKPKPEPKAPDPAQQTMVSPSAESGIPDRPEEPTDTGGQPSHANDDQVCPTCKGVKGHFEEKTDTTPERWIPCPTCQEDLTPQIVEEEPAPEPEPVATPNVQSINDRLRKAVSK